MKTTETTKLDDFTTAYIECALWSSTGDDDAPLDENYSAADIADESMAKIVADCAKFQTTCMEWIAWDNLVHFPHRYTTHGKAGHDFWLTRNGHGAGFWDGDWTDESGQVLTAASKAMGTCDLYVGDDGRIYCY